MAPRIGGGVRGADTLSGRRINQQAISDVTINLQIRRVTGEQLRAKRMHGAWKNASIGT